MPSVISSSLIKFFNMCVCKKELEHVFSRLHKNERKLNKGTVSSIFLRNIFKCTEYSKIKIQGVVDTLACIMPNYLVLNYLNSPVMA